MFWNKKIKEVFTEFVDQATGKSLASSKTPIDQIPESFEISTTIEVLGEKYNIVEASPKTKAEFSKSGKLTIVVRKIEMIGAADLLYSIPTIENTFFDSVEGKIDGNYAVIHEDDWRQAELISAKFVDEINYEISMVESIYRDNMKGNFFKAIHVRTKIPDPLFGIFLELDELIGFFDIEIKFDGFKLNASSPWGATAKNGFAFETRAGAFVFGVFDDKGILKTICFKSFERDVESIVRFCEMWKLRFLDWIRASNVGGF